MKIWLLSSCWGLALFSFFPAPAQLLATSRVKPTYYQAQTSTIRLQDALLELQRIYHVDILFEEASMQQIKVPANQLDFSGSLEKNLRKVLIPNGFGYKKLAKGGYVVRRLPTAREELPRQRADMQVDVKDILMIPPTLETVEPMAEPAKADRTVTGKTTDEKGEELPGVSVIIKGTQRGTTSDNNGNYSLKVPDGNPTLIFSFVGYIPQEVVLGNQSIVNVALLTDNRALKEVVVVGYGTQQAKDVTGAVATLNQSAIKDLPVSSLDQKMIGQVAGVQIQQVSGAPGAGTSIRIRGSGSLGAGNEPLYVVDGMPYSSGLNQNLNPLVFINPNDIESITILKDASSTAIYGSRGANGVVMITTKQGQFNRTQITGSVMRGVQVVPQKGRPKLMNQQEFIDLQRNKIDIAVLRAENRATTLADYPAEYQHPEQLVGKGTDWYDLILQAAPIQDYNVNLNRGSQDSRLSASLGYFKQDGVLRFTGIERYSARLGMDSNLGKAFRVGVSLQPTFINQTRTNTNTSREDVIGVANWANPVMSPYDANGNLIPYIVSPQSKYHSAWSFANPLFTLRETTQSQQQFQNIGIAFLEWSITPDLKVKTSVNTIWSTSKFSQYVPSTVGGSNRPPVAGTGSSVNTNGQSFNWLIENTLTYKKAFGDHRIDAVAGYTTQKNTTNTLTLTAGPYGNDLIQTINAAPAISAWGQTIDEWSIISYLGRINYGFKEKYLLTATIRSDGSSRFGSRNRYAYFPSLAGAWRISEEAFMKNNPYVNNLKLRVSYGKSGNNNIGNYSHLASINSGAYVFGSTQVSASYVGLANPYLTWEESQQVDAGVDAEFLNGRFSLTVDVYNRLSKNMLLNDVIPAITGYNTAVVNKGNVRNQGLEIALGAKPIMGTLNWDIGANIAFNRNKVLSLNDNGDRILSGNNDNNPTNVTVVGQPVGQFFGFVLDGVYSDADIANPNLAKTAQVYAGNPKYRDINGDGIVNDLLDYTIIGNPYPKFTFGLTNNLTYKRFNLGIIVNGSFGGHVMNGLRQTVDNLQGFFNVREEWVNRWRSSDNPGTGMLYGVPKLTPSWGHRVNTMWVEDASFLRIANLSLGYSLPDKLVRKSGFLEGCRLYMTIQNLAMFTRYEGANPEGQSKSIDNTLSPGFDITSYPLARTTSFGLNLQF
ncbi:SusC/RagA family TonB-linked outer membrane protein [Spirosoma aerolatum]|uniref:SusC/RagA family TonB-linked outer membrane protein n=1 Tax=Spirosoma aerolatum TaxID=1211326 RepID=UPI0009ABF556|nr:TonB-dependent receptor [Spirosoma aerolatum]